MSKKPNEEPLRLADEANKQTIVHKNLRPVKPVKPVKPAKLKRRIQSRRLTVADRKKAEEYLTSSDGQELLRLIQRNVLHVEMLQAGITKLVGSLNVSEAVLAYHPNAWLSQLPGVNKLSERALAIRKYVNELTDHCEILDEELSEITQTLKGQ